jgi:hypothetical protein
VCNIIYTARYVVRTGINFGVDYCVYHALPSQCHSEMCVTVVDAWGDRRQGTAQGGDTCSSSSAAACPAGKVNTAPARMDELSWRHVTTLTRVIPVWPRSVSLC